MHILIGLIGLTIATVIIMLWSRGTLFACVFLSIPTGLGLLLFTVQDAARSPGHMTWALVCAVLLAGIWAPRLFRLQAKAPRPD